MSNISPQGSYELAMQHLRIQLESDRREIERLLAELTEARAEVERLREELRLAIKQCDSAEHELKLMEQTVKNTNDSLQYIRDEIARLRSQDQMIIKELNSKEFKHAIELALHAIKLNDEVYRDRGWKRNEETGWCNDEMCDAYQILHKLTYQQTPSPRIPRCHNLPFVSSPSWPVPPQRGRPPLGASCSVTVPTAVTSTACW